MIENRFDLRRISDNVNQLGYSLFARHATLNLGTGARVSKRTLLVRLASVFVHQDTVSPSGARFTKRLPDHRPAIDARRILQRDRWLNHLQSIGEVLRYPSWIRPPLNRVDRHGRRHAIRLQRINTALEAELTGGIVCVADRQRESSELHDGPAQRSFS